MGVKTMRINRFAEAGQAKQPVLVDSNKITEDGINDVLITMEGIAKGHDVMLDAAFIDDIFEHFQRVGKIQAHLGHYNDCSTQDEIETLIGVFVNPRRTKKNGLACVIADLKWVKTQLAEKAINHITEWARLEPEMIGSSIVFMYTYREEIVVADPDDEDYDEARWDENTCPYKITSLNACDIVNHPAATDSLFLSQAGKATEYFERIEKASPELFERIKSFALKMFGIKDETMNKKSFTARIADKFKTKKEEEKKFGEAIGNDGMIYSYENETPQLGDVLMVRTAEQGISDAVAVAPDSEYIMNDGLVVGVDANSVINSLYIKNPDDLIENPAADEPAPTDEGSEMNDDPDDDPIIEENEPLEITDEEKEALKAKDAKKMELAKEKEKKSVPAKTNMKELSTEEAISEGLMRLRLSRENSKVRGKSVDAAKESAKYHRKFVPYTKEEKKAFASNFTNVSARCEKYLNEILSNKAYIDPIFAETTPVNWRGKYDPRNPFSIRMPILDVKAIGDSILKPLDPKACGVPEDNATAVGSEKTITACYYEAPFKVCVREFRDVFDGMVYIGTDRIPAEAVLIDSYLNRVRQAAALALVNGIVAPGGTSVCTGIYQHILEGIANTEVPMGQIFEYGTNLATFTSANVIDQITTVVMATPQNIRDTGEQGMGKNLRLYISQYLFDLFYTEYAKVDSSYANLWWQLQAAINPDMPLSATIFVPGVPFPIEFVPLVGLNNNANLGQSYFFIALKEEIGHLDAQFDDEPEVVVDYDKRARDFFINSEGVIGINYAFGKNLVVGKV